MKYLKFTSSGYKDIGIRKFEFVAKTHLLMRLLKRCRYTLLKEEGIESLPQTKIFLSVLYIFAI